MELCEDENIEWLMKSSETVEQVLIGEEKQLSLAEKKEQQLFIKVLSDVFENEPVIDGGTAIGVLKSDEVFETMLRKLKALGFFFSIRTSRKNQSRKIVVKSPEHITTEHPYSVERTGYYYCSDSRRRNREEPNNKRQNSTCKAMMHVQNVNVYDHIQLPRIRSARAKVLNDLRDDIARDCLSPRSEIWLWISMPSVHNHQANSTGHAIDSEVKAIMHSLLHSGVNTAEEIQKKLFDMVNQEFSNSDVRPSPENSAFYPNLKVIYNHLRPEGLAHIPYRPRKRKMVESARSEAIEKVKRLLEAVEKCSNDKVLRIGGGLMQKIEELLNP